LNELVLKFRINIRISGRYLYSNKRNGYIQVPCGKKLRSAIGGVFSFPFFLIRKLIYMI